MSNQPARPVVHVEPIGVDIEPVPGETIIEAAWRLWYYWPTVCYGRASCTMCHVEVLEGGEHLAPMEEEERTALDRWLPRTRRLDMSRVRLACRAKAVGAVTVRKEGVRPPDAPAS